MRSRSFARRIGCRVLGLTLLAGAAACASGGGGVPATAQQQPDRFLYESGTAALERKRWLQAREYFRSLVDTYPTSSYRQDAKLGIGDSYLGERRTESDILAASEFREFLRFYPLAPRADYAQYRLAISQVRQMLRPERDQTATRDALRELQTFVDRYPSSPYLPEVMQIQREARDRLSDSEMVVARYYFKVGHYIGVISRLEDLMKADPTYSHRDEMYYLLAESYFRTTRKAEAKPLFQKLLDEFKVSDYLDEAEGRVQELANEPAVPAAPASTAEAPAAPAAPAPAAGSTTASETPPAPGGAGRAVPTR